MTDRTFWDAVVPDEELDHDDERVNRALRWRELERHLGGVKTILDVGAGTGAFSIPLAERGFAVTHVDVSPAMIGAARTKSTLPRYVEASAADLGRFADREFDLVLNMDGAISFAGAGWARVLAESCRVGRTLLTTVSHRGCMTATWLKYSLRASGRILPAVAEMLRKGTWDKDQFPENAEIYPAVCDIPHLKAFTREEFMGALAENGMTVLAARSLGSLTHLMLPHAVDVGVLAGVEDLCEEYDLALPGPGSFRRAGLLAVARHTGSPTKYSLQDSI